VVARRDACLRGSVVVLLATLMVSSLAAQDHPGTPHRHPDAEKLQNPVPSTPDSLASGSATYAKFCANCHGLSGQGNGKLAAGISAYGARPSNLVDDVWQHGPSDGEIFTVIRDGIGPDFQMGAFGRAIPDADIWNVVNYVKSLAIK
jgi:mono/diheme cytochrome c family protein